MCIRDSGKTKAALEYNSVYPSSSYYLEATPVNGNLRSFLRALSAEMGLPDGGSNLGLENRIKEHLLGMNKVLIIDEAQNLKFTTMEKMCIRDSNYPDEHQDNH